MKNAREGIFPFRYQIRLLYCYSPYQPISSIS